MESAAAASIKPTNTKMKNRQREQKTVYSPCQITKNIVLPMNCIGKNLNQTLETTISKMIGGKCIIEGFVRPESIKIITYSSGMVRGASVVFDVVFNCEVCYPVAGMNLNCVAKNITKAGIRAESADEQPSPFVLFIARDHYFANDYFNAIEMNDKFVARVIAQRFELNDKYVSIIGELLPSREPIQKREAKPRLIMEDV
jgi:DNA-directed RNA polymerase subunit E'/Rpb7